MLHLIVGKISEPCGNDHQVGTIQRLETRNVVVDIGIDIASRRIDWKHDGTLKTVIVGKNLGQLRQAFFRTIFLVTADEHDLLSSCPGPSPPWNEIHGSSAWAVVWPERKWQ